LLIGALRCEYGVDCPKDIEKALALYEKAYRLHLNSAAFCRRLCLLKKQNPESISNCDEIVYELLRCISRSSDIIISNLWLDIVHKGDQIKTRVLQLIHRHLTKNPEDF